MVSAIPTQMKRSGFFIVLFGAVLYVTYLGAEILEEKHDPIHGIDINSLGGHVCLNKTHPEFLREFPAINGRPNERELLLARLNSLEEQDAQRSKLQENATSSIKQCFEQNQEHYLIEVRRTIFEFELGHPLRVPGYGIPSSENPIDEITGLPTSNRGCFRDPHPPQFAHDCARTDVLNWYAAQGRFATNSQFHQAKHAAVQPNHHINRTPPLRGGSGYPER